MTGEAPPRQASFAESLTRFWLGTVGGVLVGMIAFGSAVFRPDHTAFQCLTVGALLAAVLTMIRMTDGRETLPLVLLLVLGYAALRGGLAPWDGWASGIVGLLLGFGILLVALLFDELAKVGIRFGKFLVLGPLLGGVYLAVAPISEISQMTPFDSIRPILLQVFVGVVIGDGVGLGVEIAELIPWDRMDAMDAERAEAAALEDGARPETSERAPADGGA